MKKLFLLFASSVVAFGAQAQLANTRLVSTIEQRQALKGLHPEAIAPVRYQGATATNNNGTANKGTGNHSRYYNYVDYLALSVQPDINTVPDYLPPPPYLWYTNDMYSIYGATGGGVQRDTMATPSIGTVLHPQFSGYNTVDWDPGTMIIPDTKTYTVDSVIYYGTYGRNPAKANIVDTIIISASYGNGGTSNIPRYYYTGMGANYGYDTVRSGFLIYNPATHTIGASASSGVSVITKKLLLRSTDTGSNKRWSVPVNMNVPAGNWVGTSLTFRSGEVYTPYSDTVFRGSVNPTVPFKYGMIRPYVYIQDLSGFPTYSPTNYNSGQFADLPQSKTDSLYFPNWAWTTANGTGPADNQFPYVDVLISCPTCDRGVGVKQVSNAVVGSAFPNPANNTVSLPITMKQAGSVNVTLTNLVGQSMATQNLGSIAAGQKAVATFSTSGIANGVYFLTVEANGARTTTRFVVTH